MTTVILGMVWFLVALSFFGKIVAAIGAIWSARYWIASAQAKVLPPPENDQVGFRGVVITEDDGSDVLLTMKEQNRLNAIAAKWAAIAAIGVAVTTLLSFGGY